MIAIIISISINREKEFNFDNIEIADIQQYFDEGNIELSDSEIASLIDEDLSYSETFVEETLTEENLLDYLSEEDLDDEIIFVE